MLFRMRTLTLWLCSLFLGFSFHVRAQDVILKTSGEEVPSIVTEVTKEFIFYKNYKDPDFFTHKIPTTEIKKIRYENGTERKFDHKLASAYLAFSNGLNVPAGIFAVKAANNGSGYAKKGFFAQLDLGFYFYKNFGLCFMLGGAGNGFSKAHLTHIYNNTNVNSYSATSGRYHEGYVLTGFLYSRKLSKTTTLDVRVYTGSMSVSSPSIKQKIVFQENGGTASSESHTHSGSGTAWASGIGAALRYDLSRRWIVRLNLDFMSALPSVTYSTDYTLTHSNGTQNISHASTSVKQRVNLMLLGVGIAYRFKRNLMQE